jgi:hypothetical protein
MKITLNRELVLQIFIIVACLAILSLNFLTTAAHAQINCAGQPGIKTRREAWRQYVTVSVVIFATPNDDDFNKIDNSIRLWNSLSVVNCSNVNFNQATRATSQDNENDIPPNDTIWVLRPTSPNGQMIPFFGGDGNIIAVRMLLKDTLSQPDLARTPAHEVGHSLNLQEEVFPAVQNRSIMGIASTITSCDTEAVRRVYCPATPTPTLTPTPESCPDPPPTYRCDLEVPQTNCPYNTDNSYCNVSPIVVDVSGDGFSLTDTANGVVFDIANHGDKQQVSWTIAGTDDAWLALDRNGNGLIEDGRELFGDVAAQPSPPAGQQRNGFLALAEFDKAKNGGNGDGVIDNQDAIFNRLRLWQDTNHNGVSEANELHTLLSLDVATFELNYKLSKRTDDYGNKFRYRAKVWDANKAKVGRWAWDVFLISNK